LVWNGRKLPEWKMENSIPCPYHALRGGCPLSPSPTPMALTSNRWQLDSKTVKVTLLSPGQGNFANKLAKQINKQTNKLYM